MPFDLTSPAFVNGAPIPAEYSCIGQNHSPPLKWSAPPPGTKSFALAIIDPDAPSGNFHHWAVYDISGDTTQLAGGFDKNHPVSGAHEAINDFGQRGYGGPCPPPGHGTHHYHFTLFALSQPRLPLPPSGTVPDVVKAAQPLALGTAELIGTFRR
jgi:Raf kinase inhibitor-like YbhB/YbcL family protein